MTTWRKLQLAGTRFISAFAGDTKKSRDESRLCALKRAPQRLRIIALSAFAGLLLAQTTRSVWDGVYTPDQSKRGETAYAKSCASCHGSALTGGESAPPLAGGDFLSNWNGLTVGDLYDRFRTTMPADRPGALKRDEYTDILAYVLSMNQFPPGKTELERQTEVLKQIRIEPKP